MASVVQRSRTNARDEKRSGRVNSSRVKFWSTIFTVPIMHQVSTFVSPPQENCGPRESETTTLCRTGAANFIDEGVNKLFPRYDTYLNLHGDHVQKWLNVGTNILQ